MKTLQLSAADVAARFPGLVRDKDHTYTHPDYTGPLEGVTTFVKRFHEPFDAPVIAAKVGASRRPPVPGPVVEAEWRADADRGTDVHAFIEAALWYAAGQGSRPPRPADPVTNQGCHAFAQHYSGTDLIQYRVVALEQYVYDLELGLAGQFDALLEDLEGRLWLWDWKTNKNLTLSSWNGVRMREPFGQYDDCKLAHYLVQVNTYRLILRRAGIETAGAVILHVPYDGRLACRYPADDLTGELLEYCTQHIETL